MAASVSFNSLPDEVLILIFGLLSSEHRHTAALVCRRWRRCSHVPELCREVVLDASKLELGAPSQRLRSLLA